MKITALLSALIASVILISCGGYDPPTKLHANSITEDLPDGRKSPEIFKKYVPHGNSVMNPGWPSKFDASGVAWNDKRTCTLITRRHVLMAKHYQRRPSTPVVFHDRQGRFVSRNIIASKAGSGDYAVGLLDKPVPSNYTAYLFPSPSPHLKAKLMYKPVIVTDQHRRLYFHQIISFSGSNIVFRHNKLKRGHIKNLVSGDSGNPSFIVVGGKQILIETHYGGGAGVGPFYGDDRVQAEVKKMVAELDSSYSIRTIQL